MGEKAGSNIKDDRGWGWAKVGVGLRLGLGLVVSGVQLVAICIRWCTHDRFLV